MSATRSDQPVVLIIGGGIAGLYAAKTLAANGLECAIVEKGKIGGRVLDWACMATDRCLRCFCCHVTDLMADVRSSRLIRLVEGSTVKAIGPEDSGIRDVELSGHVSRDSSTLRARAVVMATGFDPYDPSEKSFWGHGTLDGVLTMPELLKLMRETYPLRLGSQETEQVRVAFFQCVGSRDVSAGANYCSQHCCKSALRAALRIKAERPDWEITIFYVDLQVAGRFAGPLLSAAANEGIRLVQGVPGEIIPSAERGLEVAMELAGRNARERCDRIVLSVGQRPSADSAELLGLLGLGLDRFGYPLANSEADSVRTSLPRVYLAGACGGPKDIGSTLDHAGQAAAAVLADLA